MTDSMFFLDYKLLDLYVEHFDIDRYYNLYTFFYNINIYINIFSRCKSSKSWGWEEICFKREKNYNSLSRDKYSIF